MERKRNDNGTGTERNGREWSRKVENGMVTKRNGNEN